MTTNQTIDGVPRELLERITSQCLGMSAKKDRAEAAHELRALLDAPAVDSPIPQHFVEACDKFDWTPEEALRFYADGKHFDTDRGRTRILCTGAIASHALKGMGEGYAAMKGIEPAAQPQGEQVAIVVDEIHNYGDFLVFGSTIPGVQRPKPVVELKAHLLDRTLPNGTKLYAEQPAPVAAKHTMRSIMEAVERSGEYTVLTSNQCAALAAALNNK